MIHEEICTYEVCKLAKEKGFRKKCIAHYYDDTKDLYRSSNPQCYNFGGNTSDAPTQSLLQRWLREEKGIIIELKYSDSTESFRPFWSWQIYNTLGITLEIGEPNTTYELALEDALKYALENLGRMTDQELKELMAKGVDDDCNICDQFNYECDVLWQLITRVCLNANPPIRVREHTIKSLKEAGVHCTLKVEGRTSKLELWRGDELVGVIINTKPERVKIGFD